jgi:hypothetical protein
LHAQDELIAIIASEVELQEPFISVARQERLDVEFILAIEALATTRNIPPQQAVGADNLRCF